MWNRIYLKFDIKVVFLLCLLEIFELVLIVNDMNKTEKLENDLKDNLQVMGTLINLLDEHTQKIKDQMNETTWYRFRV
ncbi:hypothetical protein [Helicobacter pylori]|uniref:hypothetical protein n=1 Tax=Helicobacter pylori TaxID=210 RepID=UPI000419E695|nr:hypothetical protein [Helicobacter pylori]